MKIKLKTRKAAQKRVNTKKDFLARKKAYRGHLLRKKSSKRMRHLCESAIIHVADQKTFFLMLPYRK